MNEFIYLYEFMNLFIYKYINGLWMKGGLEKKQFDTQN